MYYELYLELKSLGIMSLPCNKKKIPVVKGWKGEGIIYSSKDWEKAEYISIRCGGVSTMQSDGMTVSGIEIIDFDLKYGETFPLWSELVQELYPGLFERLYIERSPSGGMHVIYKTSRVGGNMKLAYWIRRNEEKGTDEKVCPIETRGEGGYCVIHPSPGYELINGDIKKLPILTDLERDGLINISRSFNKVIESPKKHLPPKEYTGDNAIEAFNAQYDVCGLLERHGWKVVKNQGEVLYLLRPGSKSAHSATFNHAGHRIFYVFSGNADKFEGDRGYTVFGVYSILEHGGNNKEAFKGIKMLGYGEKEYYTSSTKIINNDHPAQTVINQPTQTIKKISNSAITIKIEKMAYHSLVSGISLEEINFYDISTALMGYPIENIEIIYKNIYESKQEYFNFNRKTTQAQAEILIKDKFKLFKNVVNGGLFYKNGSEILTKTNPTEIWGEIGRSIDVRRDVVRSLCELKGVAQDYDPFLEYFESLKWSGVDEIGRLEKYIEVDEQEFHEQQFEKMFIRCVHCMLGKGENRFVWTYVGGQYIGKSYLVRFFCPPALKEYYTEERPTSDKDCAIRLQENGFYNWEELQSASNFEINQAKAMLSKSINKVRRPYGTQEESFIRRANFFGTINDGNFLTDDENTRWLPFTIKSINQKYSKNIDIDQCWAQAYHKYKAGFDFEVKKEDLKTQHTVTDKYRHMTAEEELILKYFEKSDGLTGTYLSSVDIMNKINIITTKGIKITKERVGRVLSNKKYFKRRGDNGIYEYCVNDKSNEAFGETKNPYYASGAISPHYMAESKKEDENLPF